MKTGAKQVTGDMGLVVSGFANANLDILGSAIVLPLTSTSSLFKAEEEGVVKRELREVDAAEEPQIAIPSIFGDFKKAVNRRFTPPATGRDYLNTMPGETINHVSFPLISL